MTVFCFFFSQGVLKVRKRVTLMVISVSVIFGITWLPDSILHIVQQTTSIELSPFIFPILHTMIMFNSAVNPFVYALINERFKEKIKSMLFPGSTSLVSKNSSDSDTQSVELANRNIQPTAKATSGWEKARNFFSKTLFDGVFDWLSSE